MTETSTPPTLPSVATTSIAAPTRTPNPARQWPKVLLGVVLLAVGAGAGVGLTKALGPDPAPAAKSPEDEKKPEESNDTVTMAREKQASAGVETEVVAVKPLSAFVWRSGRVALNGDHVSHISPPAEGVVRDVPVRLGQTVAAGDVLAVIDCRELSLLKLELVKARVMLATERENAARIRATMGNAEELLKLLAAESSLDAIDKKLTDRPIGEWRSQLLGAYAKRNQLRTQLAAQKSTPGAVSDAIIVRTESESDAANAAYTSLVEELRYQVKYQVRQAELKLREAETTHDVTKARLMMFGLSGEAVDKLDPLTEGAKGSLLMVKAPFAGTVVEKHAVRSERVGPQSQLFVLSDLTTVWIQSDVFEADLPMLRELADRPVTFRSSLAGVSDRTAKVIHTGDLIDKSSRTLTVTAEAANADRALKPGMFIDVGFDTGDPTPVVQVSATAILRHENKPFVFVATAGDTFVKRDVTLGRSGGEAVEITAGLKAGESVVCKKGFVLKSKLLKDQMVGE